MKTTTRPSISPAQERQLRRLSDARAYYADAETPEQHTILANRWLEANDQDRLPQAHYDVLREYRLKRCSGCRTVYPVESFVLRKNGKRNYQCKQCEALRHKAYRKSDPEKVKKQGRAASQRYRDSHPWAIKLQNGEERAREAGAPWVKIREAELLESWKIRGIDPNFSHYSGKPLNNANRSLDHLDPLNRPGTMGHTLANLFPCTIEENTHLKRGQHPLKGLKKIWETA